jgi:hypothetical protein
MQWPDIEGLRSFAGKIMHSAAWDARYLTYYSVFVTIAQLDLADRI